MNKHILGSNELRNVTLYIESFHIEIEMPIIVGIITNTVCKVSNTQTKIFS